MQIVNCLSSCIDRPNLFVMVTLAAFEMISGKWPVNLLNVSKQSCIFSVYFQKYMNNPEELRHPFFVKPVSEAFPELGIIGIHRMQLEFFEP